jgi:phage antirepressor YoqD-like protein
MTGKNRINLPDNYISVVETAKFVGITKETLGRWRKNNQFLPYIKVGNRYFYDKNDLDLFLKGKLELKESENERK